MNYLKIYEDICERGKLIRESGYYEIHHIKPRCLKGSEELDNLTSLTAREHYLAHYLLTKIYENNSSLYFAFGMMKTKSKLQERLFTSKQYENMKKSYSTAMKMNNPMKNPETAKKVIEKRKEGYASGRLTPRKLSDKEKNDASERMKGDNNPAIRFPKTHNFTNNKYVQGKHCYNNGIKNKYFNPDDEIPEGYVRGNKPRVKR